MIPSDDTVAIDRVLAAELLIALAEAAELAEQTGRTVSADYLRQQRERLLKSVDA